MKTQKFDFKNKDGLNLSGRLELPQGKPTAFALFAHCFTCSKNILAASKISKYLAEHGIAVLRFDFTGIGNSEGDFANTNFSSNTEDLMAAYQSLSEHFQAPQLLIGHSLGGAAVLKIAHELEEVECVVTIGAPSEVEHVSHLFSDYEKEIEAEGHAHVKLGGRDFTIKEQFLRDLKEHNILDGLDKVKKAFLILHSPIDNTVSVDHAGTIFQALKHPKSFLTLDNADHLVSRPEDAQYIAEVISAWSSRYIETREDEARPKVEEDHIHVQSRPGHKFTMNISGQRHTITADEPKKVKGDDLGMNPYELLLSSLGACTAMTIKMYAERKGINLDDVTVELSHTKEHIKDCEDCGESPSIVDVIKKKISIAGEFSEEQHKRLLEIAEKCPVNKTLKSDIVIETL
jgi:putative redox protein